MISSHYSYLIICFHKVIWSQVFLSDNFQIYLTHKTTPKQVQPVWVKVDLGVMATKMFIYLGLWHINICRLFNARSTFIQINTSISNNSPQHKYSLIVKTFLFQTIQFSQRVLLQTIQFSISIGFGLHTVKCQNSSISNNSV